MIEGTVFFKLANVGSKSEGVYPFFLTKNQTILRVWKKDDFSLNGIALKPYEGKHVVIRGEMDENNIFLISDIEELEKQ